MKSELARKIEKSKKSNLLGFLSQKFEFSKIDSPGRDFRPITRNSVIAMDNKRSHNIRAVGLLQNFLYYTEKEGGGGGLGLNTLSVSFF